MQAFVFLLTYGFLGPVAIILLIIVVFIISSLIDKAKHAVAYVYRKTIGKLIQRRKSS